MSVTSFVPIYLILFYGKISLFNPSPNRKYQNLVVNLVPIS